MYNNITSRPLEISFYEKISVTILFMADTLVMPGRLSAAGTGDWIASLSGAFLSIPFIMVLSFIVHRCRDYILLRTAVAAAAAAAADVSLSVFADFIKTCVLPEINTLLIPSGVLITAFYSAFRTTDTLSRAIHIIMPVIIIFSIAALLLALTRFRTDYIMVSAWLPAVELIRPAAFFAAVYTVKGGMLIYLFSSGKGHRSDLTAVCTGTVICAAVVSLMLFIALGVLGGSLYERLDYPLYYPLGLTGFGDHFERTEIISILTFMVILTFRTGIYIRLIFIVIVPPKTRRLSHDFVQSPPSK